MVKIYTRKGDQGFTGLLTGEHVAKDDPRLEALGAIDELVASLGAARAETQVAGTLTLLTAIQSELYLILADIASVAADGQRRPSALPKDVVAIMESVIDRHEAQLPPLREFVMPGESRASAALHLARTVCRRAERRVVSAARSYPLAERVPTYLNRLSDLLFVLARFEDHTAGGGDKTFKSAL